MSDLKNVVILGLGQAGISAVKSLAKSLPSTHRLVVVHQHNFSFYPVASLRAHAVPGWEKKVAVPIEGLFSAKSRHVLLEGTKVVELKDNAVVLDKAHESHGFGLEIPFEYAVVATGATYAPHCQIPDGLTSLKDVESLYAGYQSEIKEATSIVVVGAGATGIEAAAEFKELYPEKTVTIVSSGPSFLPALKPSVSAVILKKFQELDVKVIFDAQLDTSSLSTGKIEKTTLDIKDQKVEADYIFIAYGFKPNSAFMKPELLTAKGLIKVKPTLQVEGSETIFALGDVNNVDEIKLAYNALNQGGIAAANILALIKSKAPKPYKAAAPAGFITLGSKAGTGQLFGWGLPNWFVVKMKSAGLRTDAWKSEFTPLTY